MATKFDSQLDLNSKIRQVNEAQTEDVWVSHNTAIDDWAFRGRDLWDRVIDRHNELLSTGGIPCGLWQRVLRGPTCVCRKDETGQVESRCPICYGTGIIKGFEKFGYATVLLSMATGTAVFENTQKKRTSPFQIEIADRKTVGYIYSPIYHVRGNLGFVGWRLWAANGPRDDKTDLITVEYSVDGGETYTRLDSDTVPLQERSFTLRLRVTLHRENTDQHPYFSALRLRFQMSQYPRILITKRSFPEQTLLESFGLREKADGVTWWTTPTLGIPSGDIVRLQEEDIFEIETGLYARRDTGDYSTLVSGRYKPSNVTYVEPRSRFISQRFNIRILQKDEPELSIF